MDEENKEKKKNSRYLVSITGENTHFECPIDSLDDFKNLNNILKTLKKRL